MEVISRLSHTQTEAKHSEEALTLKKYIDAHTECIITNAELSKVIFRSPDYCLKLFGREFGTTPYAYQLNNKMQIARLLLSDTNMSVGKIAESLGYNDPHYFSNLFYTKCGCRPLKYRQNTRKPA